MGGISRLTVKNFGTIRDADVILGDLTFLHGPHTSDKNVLPRLIKLIVDRNYISYQLYHHNFLWKDLDGFLQLYFGIGMNTLYKQETRVFLDNQEVDFSGLWKYHSSREKPSEEVFYIPDQREHTIDDGITRPFMDFRFGTAFVARQWGYILHSMVIPSMYLPDEWLVFPQENSFQKLVSGLAVGEDVYVKMKTLDAVQQLVIERSGQMFRFAVWSAGQREFVPMLLGLFWLTSGKRHGYKYVFIEEPEKGVSYTGIVAMSALILQLIDNGYKVFVTTSDTRMLYLPTAIRHAKEKGYDRKGLLSILRLPDNHQRWLRLAGKALKTTIGVYNLQGGLVVNMEEALPPLESFHWIGE